MVETTKPSLPLPVDFADDPTEAPFPRQLIVYDEDSDTWNPTVEKNIIVHSRYLCVSYCQSDFPVDVRSQLELDVQAVCQQYDLPAYWLDYACIGSTQEEKNRDLYRIADGFRGATKTLIVIKGSNDKPHSPGWISWGDRLWTLPEALLSGYSGDKLVYRAGRRKAKPITLRGIANHAYRDGDREMTLMNVYSGEPVIDSDTMFEVLVKTIWGRTNGPTRGKETGNVFTAYEAEKVYALMGFMPKRILPKPNENDEEAFRRLMKENRLKKRLSAILNSSEEDIPLNVPMMPSMGAEQRRVLDMIPYTGGMRFKEENQCLEGTRVDIIQKITNALDNKDGRFDEKRVFLLTGVAGSGKSTIAHSIAFHYDSVGRLGSSFFFSEANEESSQARNLFRNVARDLADNYPKFRAKLCEIVANSAALSTTNSIQEQFQKLIIGIMRDIALDPIVVVIDALDECSKGGNNRTKLLDILAKDISAAPRGFRVFVTARPISDIAIFDSSRYVGHFTMDEIYSTRDDITAFFLHELSQVAEQLSTVDPEWLIKLTDMAGDLFIYAEVACRYILENEIRRPKEKLQNLLSLKNEADLNSPVPYLYELYTKVLVNVVNVTNMAPNNLESVRTRVTRVLGMVLMAYEPLSSSDIDKLLGPNDSATGIIRQMGTLLNGVRNPEEPVRPLHASLGDFLRDERFNKAFYVNPQSQHGEMAKSCLKVMIRNLRFNIFNFKDASVPDKYSYQREALKNRRTLISKVLRYSCQYWPIHVLHMSKDSIGLIEEPLQELILEKKCLLQWIEVIVVMEQVHDARDALLSLYSWLKEINLIDKRIPKLLWECYHLLRCFDGPIAAAPLQVYVSALPYLPSDSLLLDLYRSQSILPPVTLLGSLQDIRLLSRMSVPENPSYNRQFEVIGFTPDGTRYATISETKLEVFDFSTFALISKPIQLYDRCYLFAFSPDGNKIVTIGRKVLAVWSLTESRALFQDSNIGAEITAITFPSNDRIFYCINDGRSVEFMERKLLQNWVEARLFHSETSIKCLAISPNASHVCGILDSNRLLVWDTQDLCTAPAKILLGNTDSEGIVFSVLSISCDGEYIACGSEKGTLKIWSSRSPSFVWSREANHVIKQILMPFRPENKQLVTVSEYGNMNVWDTLTGSCYEHEAWNNWRSAAAMSPDGRHIVTSQGDVWLVEVNEVEPGTDKATLRPGEKLKEVVFLQDGSLIAGGEGVKKNAIVVWEKLGTATESRQTLEFVEGLSPDADLKSETRFLRFSPDGQRLLVVSQNWRSSDLNWATGAYNILLWCRDVDGDSDRFRFRERHTLDSEKFELVDAVPLANGSILVVSRIREGGNNIVLWDSYGSESGSKQILDTHMSAVSNFKISPDGRRFVSWTCNRVFLWCREGIGFDFTLQGVRRRENDGSESSWDDAVVRRLIHSWFCGISPKDALDNQDSTNSGQGLDAFFRFYRREHSENRQWVCLANGRRLWYVPDGFSGPCKIESTQRGRMIVLYSERFTILYEYKDDVLRTVLNSSECDRIVEY